MSALPPKADMCGATRDVCFGPEADIDVYPAARRGPPAFDVFTGVLSFPSPKNLLACQERLGFPSFPPFSVGILRQFHELDVICRCTRAITTRIRGAGCSPEPTISVRVCLQRCLEFRERSCRLSHF